MLIVFALLLGVIGIVLSIPRPAPPAPPVTVAYAKRDIPTYTIITPDMVEEKTVSADEAKNAPPLDNVIGRMTTRTVGRGSLITDLSALSPEQVRYVSDLGLEIISFQARFDETVGGQLKPGHKANIYAYRGQRGTQGAEVKPEVRLLATDTWVVDVRSGSGGRAGILQPTPERRQQQSGGLFSSSGDRESEAGPGSIVTVAVAPELAFLIVDTLGAQGFEAWVSLAGNRAVQVTVTPSPTLPPTATVPVATPTQDPRPIQTAVAATVTAGANAAATAAAATAAAGGGSNSGQFQGVPPTGTPRIPTTGGQKP